MANRSDVVKLVEKHDIELSPLAEYAIYNYLSSDEAYGLLKDYLECELDVEVD
jgi:hypothetical protein